MKLKNLFAAAAVAAGLCLTGMSAVQAAPKMPESISITYVKSPFNLQNIVMKERGMLEDAFKAEASRSTGASLIRVPFRVRLWRLAT